MMRALVFTLACASSLLAQTFVASSYQPSTAIVAYASPFAFRHVGTGFFVGDGTLVVTAFHVFSGALQQVAENRDGAIVILRYGSIPPFIRPDGGPIPLACQILHLVQFDVEHDIA